MTMRRDDVGEILALLRSYAALNDEGRWHEVAALFTDDARFTRPSDPGRPIVGRAAILQSLLARPKGPPRQHLVANPEVNIVDDHTARARCHTVLLTTVDASAGSGTVTVGGFEDVLTRTAEGWRFQARTGSTLFDPVPFTAHPGTPWPADRQAAAPAPLPDPQP